LRRYIPLVVLFSLLASLVPNPAGAQTVAPSLYQGMRWRFIGPLRGGRTKAVAGVPGEPNRFYIGAVNGGIWTTDDAGRTWTPIFDGHSTQSIGSLAVAPSDPNVIYAGSGEGLQRPDLAIGNGIYKSIDAGKTWTHLGLRDGEQIPQIAIDPRNQNTLFVAVLGHPYGPNDQRGIYRSTDGGKTFARVLYTNDNTGAYDVKIDPLHPDTVYATLWAARQAPWEIGGSFEIPGSGIYKSTDGGATWKPIDTGLPKRIGRISLGIAASDPSVIYAFVDMPAPGAKYRSDDAGAIYRSADGGAHWTMTNDTGRVGERGDDLTAIAADPKDPNTVYVTNTSTYRSTDGGKTFTAIKGAPGGDDYQNIWINPNDPSIILLGSDQGATISVNHGRTWSSWYNQPTAQMYHVNADNRFPYWVCGGQQESGSACVKSRGNWGEITERDWHTAGAEEYGYDVPDPLHPGIFYGGKVERFTQKTGQVQEVAPEPLRGKGYRVVRTQPLAFDPIDQHKLYFASNVVWVTSDGGMQWRAISPDLTRAHPAIPAVIRAFEKDDPEQGAHRGVVYALAPSHEHEGTIWAGTDDGLVWITRDGGKHWKNVTPPALTAWSKVSQIDASSFDDNTAYVAVNRFRLDDQHPYVYVTHDGGAHWRLAVSGLPDAPINAVRADPRARGLLYAASETGVSVSFDDGAHWQPLQLNLPTTSARDIIVHGNDLVVATHGRGFWILDDVEPLRALARTHAFAGPHLFTPELAYRIRRDTNTDTPLPPEVPHGQNPPDGAILDYALSSNASKVSLVIADAKGHVVRTYASDEAAPPHVAFDKPSYWERPFVRPGTSAGMHRFVWDLHEPAPRSENVDMPISAVPGDTPRVPQGALVVPGRYTVTLVVDGKRQSRPLTVAMDPRVKVAAAALLTQYHMAHDVATLIDRTYGAIQSARAQHQSASVAALEGVHGALGYLLAIVDGADAAPTAGIRSAYCSVTARAFMALRATPQRSSSVCH